MVKEVDFYLENILKPYLLELGITSYSKINNNVKKQMLSLLYHWQDTEFRNTILMIGEEEAIFYESKCSLEIKSFVVMTIRNSLIEVAGSVEYQKYGFENRIEDMKQITMNAIRYFKDLDFNLLSSFITSLEEDYYKESAEKYPTAFELLKLVSKLEKKEMRFSKLSVKKCSNLGMNYLASTNLKEEKIIESGYQEELSVTLKNIIRERVEHNIPFYVDSFKVASRRFDKLLQMIQYLLEQDSSFVTTNYYISNGYISKRLKKLKPSHTNSDMKLNISNVTGISDKHKQVLKNERKSYYRG